MVKTGYQLLGEMENREVASGSDQSAQRSSGMAFGSSTSQRKCKIFAGELATRHSRQ